MKHFQHKATDIDNLKRVKVFYANIKHNKAVVALLTSENRLQKKQHQI